MPGTSVTQRCSPTTWTVAAAMPTPAIQRPRVPPARRPSQMPAGANRAALTTSTRNHVITEPWCSRNRARMSEVGSSRICGYSKTEPSTVNPAMARADARARAAAGAAGGGAVDGVHGGAPSMRGSRSVGGYGGGVAVPRESGGERLVERGGEVAEGGPELAVVDDPRVGELVERVQVLAHLRLEQPDRAQRRPAGGQDAWLVPGERVDRPRRPRGWCASRATGRCQTWPVASGDGAQRDQPGRDVRGVGVAVRLVGICPSPGRSCRRPPYRRPSRRERTAWRRDRSSPTHAR